MERPPHSSKASKQKEQLVFDFEAIVFDIAGETEGLSEGSNESIKEAYSKLEKAKDNLKQAINLKKALLNLRSQPIKIQIDQTAQEVDIVIDTKTQDRNYDFAEKNYFESVMAFNYMSALASQDEVEKKAYLITFHQAQSVFLAFQTFMSVRSFMHKDKKGNLRDSGEVKVQHVYDVAIAQMNRYLEKLQQTQTQDEYLQIIQEMQFSVVVSLLHDFLEDHEEIDIDAFWQVLESRTRYDSKFIILINNHQRQLGLEPHIPNFFKDNKQRILKRMRALKKPPTSQQNGYLRRQILENDELSDDEKVDLIITKLCDRQKNLESLAYMKDKLGENGKVIETGLARQRRKLTETNNELLPLAQEIYDFLKKIGARHVEDIPTFINKLKETYDQQVSRLEEAN